MEPSNQVPAITIAPKDAGPCVAPGDTRATPVWREHWMQAVYFPRRSFALSFRQKLCLHFVHDAFSMRFNLYPITPQTSPLLDLQPSFCHCLTHVAWPRSRFAQLSHPQFRKDSCELAKFITEYLPTSPVALVIVSDASVLPLQIYHLLPASNNIAIFHLDSSPMSLKIMEPIYRSANAPIVLEENEDGLLNSLRGLAENSSQAMEICVVSEPFIAAALLPWNSINFWYVYGQIKKQLPNVPCQLLAPTHLRIKAVAMDFEHLWKIRAPVGQDCEGFDLRLFDEMVLTAAAATDAPVEPHPLWQYAGKARSEAISIFEMSLLDPPIFSNRDFVSSRVSDKFISQVHTIPLFTTVDDTEALPINAVAMWAEWQTPNGRSHVVGGPSKPIKVGYEVEWCRVGSQTGVFFLPQYLKNELNLRHHTVRSLKVESKFDFCTREPYFNFSVI